MANNSYQKFKDFLFGPLCIFLLIALSLVAFWFRGRNPLGGGEIGSPYYNIGRMFGISLYAWNGILLGMTTGLSVVAVPLYWFFTQLQSSGIPGFLIQSIFFFICLTLVLFSMYALTKELFPGKKRLVYFSAAIFYLVNPYALVNVWNRFLQNPMLFYALLPFGLWLYIRGLKKRKYSFAVLNMALTGVFSFAFAGPSQTLLFWGLLFLISIYYFVFFEKDRFVVIYFLLNIFFWVVFNFFWISQQLYFRFSPSFADTTNFFFTYRGNVETFNALSRVLGQISNLLIFQHGTFFRESVDYPYAWPLIYRNPAFLLIQWAVVILVLALSIRKRKEPWVTFLLSLFFLGFFVAKGNSAPLGEVLDLLFKKLSFLEFFRNPFEKTALLLPLSFSPLFGISVQEFLLRLKRKWNHLYLLGAIGIFGYLILFLGFPYWTGLVFTSNNPPANNPNVGYQVQPPEYYRNLDKYLENQPGFFRFITFPLGGEGIFNIWPKGYAGVEQSAILFSTPSISYNTSIPYFSSVANVLEELFLRRNDFYKVARLLNAKFLVFRPDFDFKLSGMRDPGTIQKVLDERIKDSSSQLSHVSDFGALKLYEFSDDVFLPKIYSPQKLFLNNNPSYVEDALFAKNSEKIAIYSASEVTNPKFVKNGNISVLHSSQYFQVPGEAFPSYSDEVYIFPHVSNLPASFFYPFVLSKEKLQEAMMFRLSNKADWELAMLGKRLVEAQKSSDRNDVGGARVALSLYEKALPSFISKVERLSVIEKLPGERVWHQGALFSAFSSHIYVLNGLKNSKLNEQGFVSAIAASLRSVLAEEKILPVFDPLIKDNFPLERRIVYQLAVSKDGEYEILIPITKLFPEKFTLQDRMPVQIDDFLEERSVEVKDGFVSLGFLHLQKGIHEIEVNQNPKINLIQNTTEFDLSTADKIKEISIPISDFDPYSQYDVSFDYWVERGDGLKFTIEQNINPLPTIRRPEPSYFASKTFIPDYLYNYISYSTYFGPIPFADSAELKFSVRAWSNCRFVLYKNPDKCKDENVDVLYRRLTRVFVRNVKVAPLYPRKMLLVSREGDTLHTPEKISFERINQTKYRVHVKGAHAPFLLVFSELYDSGWKAYLTNSGVKTNENPFNQSWRKNMVSKENHILVNGYANAWWIDRTGDFEVVLEYGPQRLLYVGYAISVISALLAVGYLLGITVIRKN